LGQTADNAEAEGDTACGGLAAHAEKVSTGPVAPLFRRRKIPSAVNGIAENIMKALRIIFAIVGVLAFLMGLLWIGQGTGLFPYPATSPMINQSPWIWRGALLALAGVLVFWVSRRVKP
jgi:hypothetical protein